MIVYNMRHRGPYEYDKFVLNVMQFHNEVNTMVTSIENATAGGINAYKHQLDDLIDKLDTLHKTLAYQQEKIHL